MTELDAVRRHTIEVRAYATVALCAIVSRASVVRLRIHRIMIGDSTTHGETGNNAPPKLAKIHFHPGAQGAPKPWPCCRPNATPPTAQNRGLRW